MSIKENYTKQLELALEEFGHIIEDGEILETPGGLPQKLRLYVIDNSIIDVFLSSSDRYSYHWERRHVDGSFYRHDNAPHNNWSDLKTFPRHFHCGSNDSEDVKSSYIPRDCLDAIEYFLNFIERELSEEEG